MIDKGTILGVVLAGGLSRRMEGQEKSLIKLHGQPLIKHAINRLKPQLPKIIINANGKPKRFAFLDLPVQADTVDGYAGPLAGVLAGMAWAEQNDPDVTHVLTVASDTPFFPETYFTQMLKELAATNSEIALAASNGRQHPVFGLWPVSLHKALQSFLIDEENRKVMLFVERYSHCLVEFSGRNIDPFFNVNTPDDLLQASNFLSGS